MFHAVLSRLCHCASHLQRYPHASRIALRLGDRPTAPDKGQERRSPPPQLTSLNDQTSQTVLISRHRFSAAGCLCIAASALPLFRSLGACSCVSLLTTFGHPLPLPPASIRRCSSRLSSPRLSIICPSSLLYLLRLVTESAGLAFSDVAAVPPTIGCSCVSCSRPSLRRHSSSRHLRAS